MEYTKGPWHAEDGFVFDANGYRVADTQCDDQEAAPDGNAVLIAAAPELLAALEQVVEWLDKTGESSSAGGMEYGYVKDARAAIARARGVSA